MNRDCRSSTAPRSMRGKASLSPCLVRTAQANRPYLKAIADLTPKSGGRVKLGERDITRSPAHEMIEAGVAFAPQTENVFVSMSVDDNLKLAAGPLPRGLRRGLRRADRRPHRP